MVEGCGCGGEKHGHHADPHTQGVCHCGHIPRRFLSKNEKIENLEKYREALKNELAGVEEELEALKKAD
ncbi:MAG: hypothetical protein EHM14_10580 [Methanothrix sp.]|nr:MAG: hypothetical protein EHM14_10580 [Methanothrix sp.]